MRPRERRDSGGADLFRARLDQIIDLNHELAKLARAIDWRFLEEKFGAVYTDRPGRPPLPTRLMAGLAILKHTFDLSDEGIDHPIEAPHRGQVLREGRRIGERRERMEEVQATDLECGLELLEEQAAEQAGQHAHRQEEAGPSGDASCAVG